MTAATDPPWLSARYPMRMGACMLVLTVCCLCAPVAAQEGSSQEEATRDLVQERAAWFYWQRAYPYLSVPAGARLQALQQLRQHLATEAANRQFSQAAASIPTWTFIGPQPITGPDSDPVVSGRVTALAVDPRNANIVYLGGAVGGVWKTTDGGATWTPLTDTQASLAVGSIALDPTHPDTVYVGTGEDNSSGDSYYGAGILKSMDGGTTWAQFCGPFCGPTNGGGDTGGGAHIGGLAVHPTNSQVLLAAVALVAKDGVYRSTDGGMTPGHASSPAPSFMELPSCLIRPTATSRTQLSGAIPPGAWRVCSRRWTQARRGYPPTGRARPPCP